MQHDCPTQWQEDPTPEHLIDCNECGLLAHGSRMIWGEGNPGARIMVILDNPGAREDKEGNQIVCGTRMTLQETAHRVGLAEQDLYITYILKRRPRRQYNKEQTRQICMQHLEQLLQTTRPSLVLCLGNVAVQSFFQDTQLDVKTLRGTMQQVNGYLTTVAYHPLAIRRRPNLYNSFLEDWQRVAEHYRFQGNKMYNNVIISESTTQRTIRELYEVHTSG